MTWDRGSWMQTFTGRQFFPLDPHPDDIDIVDIAHALALICRYGGHTTRHYSVAEHCVQMSYFVPEQDALWALLHDATEAYVGDMVRPLKNHMPAYRAAEDRVMTAIARRFEINPGMPASVKEADNRILLDERAAVMAPSERSWAAVEGLVPLGAPIEGWSPALAEWNYRERFELLLAERNLQDVR
jgi:uncharacterized protein